MRKIRIEDRGSRIEEDSSLATGRARSSILDPRSSKGFTLLELIAVISIIVILAGVFLTRVPFYQEQAEQTSMEQVAGAVQTALVLRYGALMARGALSQQELSRLTTDNPMDWLQQKPKNYAGEFFDPTPGAIAPGHWMFDLKARELVYVPAGTEYFKPGRDGKKWIRFHVRLDYQPALGKSGSKELAGTLFEPVEPFDWVD